MSDDIGKAVEELVTVITEENNNEDDDDDELNQRSRSVVDV